MSTADIPGPLLEDELRRAYYYTETGAWRGPLTQEADRWRAVAAAAALKVAAERERCARLCEPTGPRPCDCERCDCGNATDARMVAEWDEAAAMAKRIRGPNA